MDDINTEFDNLSELSDVKNFDQGQDKLVSIFDIPQIYQEFDHVENEIDKSEQSFNEVKSYSDRLQTARVVRRDDALALESIIGDLTSLPHINSYTSEYSLVNYNITQESVFSKLKEVTSTILKNIWEFILKNLEFVYKHLKSLFNDKKYQNTPKAREQAIIIQAKAQEAVKNVSSTTASSTTQPVNDVKEKERVDKMNKRLRDLLYPAFTEITILSRGGNIVPDLLIDELCEQRFKFFYTTFFKAVYENDYVLSDFFNLYTHMLNSDVDVLSRRSEDFQKLDLSVPTSEKYQAHYLEAPEQLKAFVKKFGVGQIPKGDLKDKSREFRSYAVFAHDISSSMVNINLTHDLPEPRALLTFNLEWFAILDKVTMKTIDNVEDNYNTLKKLKAKANNQHNDIDPTNKDSVSILYNDWLVLHKAMLTTGLFLARLNSISKNYRTLMEYIIKATEIMSE